MGNIPYGDAGLAGAQQDLFKVVELFAGDAPVVTGSATVASAAISGADLPAFTVVGRVGNSVDGELTPAIYGSVHPVGITTALVKKGATDRRVAIYLGGYFNSNALNFDSSFDDDTKIATAFTGKVDTIFLRAIPEFGA